MAQPIVLDGREYAVRRLPALLARSRATTAARGRPPRVRLIGFGPDGELPRFIERKVRDCARVGVEALPLVLAPDATTRDVVSGIARGSDGVDAVFVEFPLPPLVDGAAIAAAIPARLDVDVMSPARASRFRAGEGDPPATVSAVLALLVEYGVSIRGLQGALIADASPFVGMFLEALERAGASVALVPPADARAASEAGLVVVAAARPRLLRSADVRPGAVLIDVGYYNPGGVGDVDLTSGTAHLRAICPVPGGIGPATISILAERVIAAAENDGVRVR